MASKTIIVDPNSIYGDISSLNVPVPLEDLNISVQLETERKARTVLTATKQKGEAQSTGSVKLRIIEGEKVNEQHELTTSFTDLTTVFENNSDSQSIGITGIDIDFNSSYAPLVNITFVDLRGSAIFQNEQNLSGDNSKNKYSVFFELPYPIFTLTVKGYYGKPVKYCLHMTKWNSKFNSQTGNFEITANFIGYTYAMLSDMLIGYLNAIAFTDEGEAIYDTINKEREAAGLLPILKLSELSIKIRTINDLIQKLAASDPNTKVIDSANKKSEILNTIETIVTTLGRELENDTERLNESNNVKDTYDYIIVPHEETPTLKVSQNFESIKADATFVDNTAALSNISNVYTQSTKQPNQSVNTTNTSDNGYMSRLLKESKYNTDITENINEYNNLGQPILDENRFSLTKLTYKDLTLDELDLNNHDNDSALAGKLQTNDKAPEFVEKRQELYEYITTFYQNIGPKQRIDVYDVKTIYLYIEEERKKLSDSIETSTRKLAEEIKNKIGGALGFEPSVRQIVEIFTTSVEVFMQVLYNVSVQAESDVVRAKELKTAFPKNDNTDIVGVDSLGDKYYAWPDYREDDAVNGYVEKYLGAARGLKNPKNITELRFIDRLLKAFLDAAKAEKIAENELTDKQSNWLPTNPIDTRIFINSSPYKRLQCTTPSDVLTLMLVRAMTFLGYSNDDTKLKGEDIVSFAQAEANAVLIAFAEDSYLINAIRNIKPENVVGTVNKINGSDRSIVTYDSSTSSYSYTYIFGDKTPDTYKIIPLSGYFKGEWEKTLTNDNLFTASQFNTFELDLKPTTNSEFEGLIYRGNSQYFLSNYSSIKELTSSPIKPRKIYDGGTYVKIITPSEYSVNSYQLVETVNTNSVLQLSELKKNQRQINHDSAGFTTFGGVYGIQEFSSVNWGDDNISLTANYLFFDGYNVDYEMFNGLGRDRGVSSDNPTKNFVVTKYDKVDAEGKKRLSFSEIERDEVLKLVYGKNDSEKVLHKDFGKNINLFNDFKNGDSTITYPYVNTRVLTLSDANSTVEDGSDDYEDYHVFSLFGSLLYYAQDKSQYPEHARALLFLNTLPWNGRTFDKNEIINLFSQKSGFVKAPRLWCAYIGGLMWRYDLNEEPIQWFSGQTGNPVNPPSNAFPYIPTLVNNNLAFVPRTDTFMDILIGVGEDYMKFGSNWDSSSPDRSDLIYSLPHQIRDEFKRIFLEFVEGTSSYISWNEISSKLEIWGGSSDAFKTFMDGVRANEIFAYEDSVLVSSTSFLNQLQNVDNYRIITPMVTNRNYGQMKRFDYCVFLELDGNYSSNVAVRNIINALTDEVIIANANYRVWQDGYGANNPLTNVYEEITASEENVNLYIKSFMDVITASESNTLDEKKQQEQELFGTTDENIIKLMLYRTCKNINDKWLAGVTEEGDLIFQCGARNPLDSRLKDRYRGTKAKTRLIDSFRFVNRSFKDIGDELYVNPLPINDYLINNPNSSFYDVVTSILSDNNFDFIALPTYINYRDENELRNVFKPYPSYEEALANMEAGPSFVCVYVGQKSKHLDLGRSNYPNDGFDFVGKDGNISPSVPKDFNNDATDYENMVPVFCVNYSQQNQNYFKDIILDQSEFTETAESLQIMDDISTKGMETNRTFGGQNMYNVYSVRSYKAEVEMLGNALIQPMMYFQLNNIPMFHGAYMITRVRHSIKPNHMSTNFTGVRIRGPETPLFTAIDLYENLLASIDLSISSGGNAGNTSAANAINDPSFNQNIIPDPSLQNNPINGFANPVANSVLTSGTGMRRRGKHEGLDLGVPQGTDAYAIADGVVERIKWDYTASKDRGYGLYIVINHGVLGDENKVYKSVYGHMSYIPKEVLGLSVDTNNLSNADVDKIRTGYAPGTQVKKGQIIGKTGGQKGKTYLDSGKKYDMAGGSTGAHLHFELRIGSESQKDTVYKNIQYVDALAYLPLGQNPKFEQNQNGVQSEGSSFARVETPTNETRLKLFDTFKTWT